MKFNKILVGILMILTLAGCASASGAPNDYVFMSNGVEIEIGDDVDEIISRLGKPNRTSSAESCAGVGCDEIYIYSGFRIGAYREGDDSEIVLIELTNDTSATKEGIRIGSPESNLLNAYGEGREFPGGIEYISDDCTLRFYLSTGRVSAIKYLKNGS